jgi:hypothetical protein
MERTFLIGALAAAAVATLTSYAWYSRQHNKKLLIVKSAADEKEYETIVDSIAGGFEISRIDQNRIVKSFIVAFKAGLTQQGGSISSSLDSISNNEIVGKIEVSL